MASTFGTLSSAYSGLAAARAAIDVTGQNIANVGTEGYTRQRVEQAAVPGTQTPALFSKGAAVGAGVAVIGIARLNDTFVDGRVRSTASTSGYWDTASAALSTVEGTLNEPGSNGISASLNDFWADWQNMANSAGSTTASSQANVLIGQGRLVASRIASGYTAAANAWSDQRAATTNAVTAINSTAKQIATLNQAILRTTSAGGNADELMDQRDTAITSLAALTGSTSRQNPDGTIDVLVGGNALVSGLTARSLQVAGSPTMAGASASPVHVEWTDTQTTASLDGGSVAAQLATLAGPSGGSGGVYAEAGAVYDRLASQLATTVNGALANGYTADGTKGAAFFQVGADPAALSLTVAPASVAGIALNSSATSKDGAVADVVSQLGSAADAPDVTWSAFVSGIGVQSKNAATQSTIADSAHASATTAQTSQSGVDLDEETTNLVTFQHAYQAAARVITTIDSMLDTLINRTGVVG